MIFRSPNNRGFTLLEVLISIALLVVISFTIFQTTTETFRLRDMLLSEGDFQNGIRLSMGILDRDISLMYSPLPRIPSAVPGAAGQAPAQNLPPGAVATAPTVTTPAVSVSGVAPMPTFADVSPQLAGDSAIVSKWWGPTIHLSGIRAGRFVGTERTLSFTTVGHVKIYKDVAESVFERVSYEFEKLKQDSTFTLTRFANANAFDVKKDVDNFTRSYVLLTGIVSYKLQYYDRLKKQKYNSWDSESPDLKLRFPDSIELEIKVNGNGKLKYDGFYRFRVEIPFRDLSNTL